MGKTTKTVGAVERAFEIVEALEELGEAGASEVANELSLPKSTAYTHLNTLHSRGYLVKDGDRYRLSCQFLHLGSSVQEGNPLYRRGKKEVDELAADTGERANLVIEERGKGTCIHASDGEGTMDNVMSLGERRCMHSTATGKAILAYLPEERVDEIVETHGLPEFTERTITSRGELDEELADIRENGVSYDREEAITGLRCIAAPVVIDDEPIGSISVSGPSRRFTNPRRKEELEEAVRESANVIQLEFLFG
ncbi:IclR family transcriptional regulator [Halobaculum sp. EA56]|uniref:IclR family transcriptional regulator n=1 Tax=Halobaculum sp. EA56 TaxID=3421648 RepID=UPI003EBC191B